MKFTWRILKKFLGIQHSICKIHNYLNQEMGIPFITASATKYFYFILYNIRLLFGGVDESKTKFLLLNYLQIAKII